MGSMLPSAVLSTIVERHGAKGFHVGVAEMNGWRNDMEDAHIIFFEDTWGFFGVFDGHGGQKCSEFVASRIRELLTENGCPSDDAAVKKLVLDVDQEFLDTQQPSGSTAAMCIVHLPTDGGKHLLRVVNAGDSRVLLGRRDGTIVDGGGTDQGLTTDHKPNHPVERERIERCGGSVEIAAGGVPRVNGDLAVSRGFGDRSLKQTGPPNSEPNPEDHPVTANPELGRFECDPADFLLIVCDGVSEGQFPNPEVVSFVADHLRENGDPGAAARAVCHKAVETNSKDNITCMCILFSGWDENGAQKHEFIPGPMTDPGEKKFMKAYKSICDRAGFSLGEAVKMRYEAVAAELESIGDPNSEKAKALKDEQDKIGDPGGSKGSAEYNRFFEQWESNLTETGATGQGPNMSMELLSRVLSQQSQQLDRGTGEFVRTPDLEELEKAINDHEALKWDERCKQLVNTVGEVLRRDATDGTTKVRFADAQMVVWIPTEVLTETDPPEKTGASI